MARLIAAGHASCDLPFRPVDRNVFNMDTVFVDKVEVLTGGDALNVSVGLNKLGMGGQMRFVSVVGDDTFGRLIVERLREYGVDTSGMIVKPEVDSIVTGILIDEDNERHFLFSGNSARNLTVEDVVASFADDTEYLHIGSFMSLDKLEHENAGRLFAAARKRGIKTSFDVTYDASGEWLGKIKSGLPYTDIFFASYDEAVSLSGGLTAPEDIAAFFRQEGVGSFVLKLGKKGCYATDYTTVVEMPTYLDLPVVDTTGAGDSFVSGYLYGLLRGFTMAECCLLGNVNGTLAVGSLGANTGSGTLPQLRDFIRRHGAQTLDADALLGKL